MDYFEFKQFRVCQEHAAFKVGTDGVLLGAWSDISSARRILDIGTGTGLIALMLAQRSGSETEITALEPDKESYFEAAHNAGISPWKKRINIINKRVQDFIPGEMFDMVISNPPFFRNSLCSRDERVSRARHDSDLNSTDLIRSVNRLTGPHGRFCLILPYAEAAMFIAEASGYGLYCNKVLKIKPVPSSPVKRMLMEFGKEKEEFRQSFITIEKGRRHEYTESYKRLTGDFYPAF